MRSIGLKNKIGNKGSIQQKSSLVRPGTGKQSAYGQMEVVNEQQMQYFNEEDDGEEDDEEQIYSRENE